MPESDYGIESSREFPRIVEGLVRANMLQDSWFGTFRTMHDTISSMSLPETSARTDQILAIRPNQISSRLSLVLAEIRVDGPLQGTQAFREHELFMVFMPYRVTRTQLLQRIYMVMDCAQGECLVSLNGRIMTEMDEIHRVSDGSTLRIWYTVFPRQEDPADLVPGLEQTFSPMSGTTSTEDERTSSTSTPAPTEAPQYVPGTFLQNLVTLALFSRSCVAGWHERKGMLSVRNAKHELRYRTSFSTTKRTTWRSWRYALLLLAGLWTGSSQAHRFGEALHPGPDAWIGTLHPSGVSGKEPIIARVPYGVWGITEHLSGVNQKAVCRLIKREAGRHLFCVPGAAVALRARSSSAGVWAGIMQVSDLIPKELHIHSLMDEYKMGRVQILQFFSGPLRPCTAGRKLQHGPTQSGTPTTCLTNWWWRLDFLVEARATSWETSTMILTLCVDGKS